MLTKMSCREFATALASNKPVPGGGGAAAYVASLGAALNTMVANFSMNNKKLSEYNDKHKELIERGDALREKLVDLVDKDAELFEPLSNAFRLPTNTDEEKQYKEEEIQKNLKLACLAPMEILELSYDAIILHQEIENIASYNIISDIGVGVQCLKSALHSAYINVVININSIDDSKYVSDQREKAEKFVSEGSKLADEIYDRVMVELNK